MKNPIQRITDFTARVELELGDSLSAVLKTEEIVSRRVLQAFHSARVSDVHLRGSTGYGYSDTGREALDKVFAEVMQAEDALVRHTMVSGTHAIATALFGVLRPNDVMLSVTGAPYDTLEETIGARGAGCGSLMELGVQYRQLELLPDGTPDYEGIASLAKAVKVVYIQKSRGYSLRKTLSTADIERIALTAKKANRDVIVIVDNCYGELVEPNEPCYVGADLVAGSLIKNLGGGIARTGGYIAGRRDLVELCAYRLTAPGMGKEVGCTLDTLRELFLGVFLAPRAVSEATRTAILAAGMFYNMGFDVYPLPSEPRFDIIQSIVCQDREIMLSLCRGIQACSPIDSFVAPEPWDMPGYADPVVMAAGTFTQGASIELSADGPMREPFAVWLQGGLSYAMSKNMLMGTVQYMLDEQSLDLDRLT